MLKYIWLAGPQVGWGLNAVLLLQAPGTTGTGTGNGNALLLCSVKGRLELVTLLTLLSVIL